MAEPLCLAGGAAAAKLLKQDEQNLDENSTEKEKIVDKEILQNGELTLHSGNTDNIDIDAEDQAYHNAGTMRFRNKKTGSNNTDLDSIEHLDFDEEDGKKNEPHLDDDIDSVS